MSDNHSTSETEQGESHEQTPFETFLDHQKRALDETGKAIESLLPPDFVSHAKEAQKEFLTGFKVLADSVIDELEKVAKKTEESVKRDDDKPSTTGTSKVKVEVD